MRPGLMPPYIGARVVVGWHKPQGASTIVGCSCEEVKSRNIIDTFGRARFYQKKIRVDAPGAYATLHWLAGCYRVA